jgi:preprotein translocase subunit SecF
VENALVASLGGEGSIDLTLSFDEKAGTLTVVPANGGQSLSADNVKTITASLQEELKDGNVALSAEVHNAITLVTSNSVKATVGKGFFIKCLFAMVLGGIFLTLYIGIRFRKIGGVSAGLFATFALIHDILIAYLVYVVFRIPLDDNFIAVVLTILGYSINGTIVIYDRIRENERKFGDKLTIENIVNRSVNETVNRNVFTSLTTLIAVVCILVVAKINGLESIISFAFPMAVGILSGFYSSVLLSSPMWAWWRTKKLAKEKK